MNLVEFEQALRDTKKIEQLNRVLKNYLNKLDITAFSFTYYAFSRKSCERYRYDFASENFKLWHQHYLSQAYENIDNTHKLIKYNTLPCYWNLQQQLKEAKSDCERQIRLDSIAYGIECGVSIPIHGPNDDFANFLVAQMRGEKCLVDWKLKQYDLFVMAHYYFQHLQPYLNQTKSHHNQYQLSAREKQCLIFTGQGFSVAAIAKRLHITERTVNYHMQKANKCLGTANKYQSVEKALTKGLFVL